MLTPLERRKQAQSIHLQRWLITVQTNGFIMTHHGETNNKKVKEIRKMNRQVGCGTLGLGCMGMVNPDRNEDYIRVIHKALDEGITFFNTGDFYGHGRSHRCNIGTC